MATSSTQEGGEEGTYATYTKWIDVQKKTFTNWVNEKLKDTPYKVEVLENDLDDGVTLIKLLEMLAKKKMHKRYNAQPQQSIHRRENLETALEFMKKVENIKLENIGAGDIIGHNLTLILALVRALILRYQMARRQPDTVKSGVEKEPRRDETADELLLGWIRMILPGNKINNLTSAWNDGQNLSALVDYCEPGLIPNHASLDPKNRLENVRYAMTLAEQHLNIPQVMHPEDLAVDHPDKLSTMTYLSQFWWRSRHQHTSPQQDNGTCESKEIPETQLQFSIDQLEASKQQAKKELQQQFEEEMLQMIAKKDAEHKKQLDSKLETQKQRLQEEYKMQVELEKKELETKLKVLNERECLKKEKELESVQTELQQKTHFIEKEQLKREKELESVQSELQREKQKTHAIEEKHRNHLATLEYERLLKEKELLKKDKEINEHRKELESVKEELEMEKQRLPSVQEEQVSEDDKQSLETVCLKALSYVDPALRKSRMAYFRGFFILRTSLIINGQPAQIGPNDQGWLTLRCPTTNAAVTFNDLYNNVLVAMQKYSGIEITNYWASDAALFQLNISSTDSLQKLINSKSKLQKELTTQISQLFKKSQVQVQPQVFLILPSTSRGNGKIIQVTADNAAQSMAQWEGSVAFTFQDVFQQWNDHYMWNEPTLGVTSVGDLVEALEEVAEWFQFGILLKIPHHKLSIIKADHQCVENCKREMLQWWLNNNLEARWSTIVQALVKAGKRVLAHKIALDHGVPAEYFSNEIEAAITVEPPADMDWREKLAKMEASIKAKDTVLASREEDLKVSQEKRKALTHEMEEIRDKIGSAQGRIEALVQERDALERDLKLRELEIDVLRLKNSSIVTIKEQEIAYNQKQLESIGKELEAEKKKGSPLQEELQRKRVEVAEKMKDIQYLTEARDRAVSELEREKEKAEQKSKEFAAAAESHAARTMNLQVQVALLKESKEKNDHMIHTLQKSVEEKNAEIQQLARQVAAKEDQMKQQTNTLDAVVLAHTLELEDMKTKIIELEHERDCARTAAELAQENASLYAEALLRTTELTLKWSDRKKAPEGMERGAVVVQGTIAYVIGRDSQTIYSYRLDRDKWSKHCQCPYVNPGLVIINDLLTAIGGKEGGHITNKVTSWNQKKWVETFPPMQTPREGPAVVHYGDYIIVVGGDREKRGVELLHIPSHLWSTVTSLPGPLSRITATLCHDEMIAMGYDSNAVVMNIEALLSSISLEESSEHSQWMPLPECPVSYAGPTVTCLQGQTVVISYDGIFQLQERQWMVVVGGRHRGCLTDYLTSTDAVHVAVIV